MLPAYFASTFHRRTQIVGMTLVFATGVATIILPIALGASAISGLVSGHHTVVFTIGGLAMLAMGLAMVLGVKFMLPMPALRGGTGHGLGSVYGLGVFSGAASACCAPVLAGVAAISGATASFPAALSIGVAYVFGMVAPLSVIAVLWDRHDWGRAKLLTGRSVTLRLRDRQRIVPLSAAVSGALLTVMGILTIVLAFRRQSMATDGWQVRVSAALTHTATVLREKLAFIPGPVLSALMIAGLVYLVLRAVRARRTDPSGTHASAERAAGEPADVVGPGAPAPVQRSAPSSTCCTPSEAAEPRHPEHQTLENRS